MRERERVRRGEVPLRMGVMVSEASISVSPLVTRGVQCVCLCVMSVCVMERSVQRNGSRVGRHRRPPQRKACYGWE